MDKRPNSQSVGLITLMVAVTCVVAFFSLRSGQRQSLPPLIVKDPPQNAVGPAPTSKLSEDEPPPVMNQASQGTGVSTQPEIVVHVAGAVFRPDVYHLPAGSRVTDAIRAAGGATQFADTNAINLAAPVQDGSKIFVPQYGQQVAQVPAVPQKNTPAVNTPSPPNTQPQSTQDEAPPQSGGDNQAQSTGNQAQSSSKFTDTAQGVVNINTASADELQRLPGVGPAIAQRIIDYRQANGGFKTAEDLKSVSGIGEKKYAKLAAFITVN